MRHCSIALGHTAKSRLMIIPQDMAKKYRNLSRGVVEGRAPAMIPIMQRPRRGRHCPRQAVLARRGGTDATRSGTGPYPQGRILCRLEARLSVPHGAVAFPSRIRNPLGRRDHGQVLYRRSCGRIRSRPADHDRSEPAAELDQRHPPGRNRAPADRGDPVPRKLYRRRKRRLPGNGGGAPSSGAQPPGPVVRRRGAGSWRAARRRSGG